MFEKKNIAIIFSVAAVTIIAAVGLVAGSVSAQTEDAESPSFTERVATILGLSSDQVEEAFQRAKDDLRSERTQSKLDALVSDGSITQTQADEITAWYTSKPEVEINFSNLGGKLEHNYRKTYGTDPDKFATMVENRIISQAGADALQAWYDTRPPILDELETERRNRHGRHGHGRSNKHWDGSYQSDETTA